MNRSRRTFAGLLGVLLLGLLGFWVRSQRVGDCVIYNSYDASRGQNVQRTLGSWDGRIIFVNSRLYVGSLSRLYWWGENGEPGLRYGKYDPADRAVFLGRSKWNRLGFRFENHWYQEGGETLLVVPYWLPVAFLVTLLYWIVWRPVRVRRRRMRLGLCGNCGYDLRAGGERCPECGERTAQTTGAAML